MTEDTESASTYLLYFVDCPYCGDVNELGDADPDPTHDCQSCGQTFEVTT